ncbi:DUF4825 domain-containing protein [Bacillus coreaensis]
MRQRQIIKYCIFSLLVMLFLSGCNPNDDKDDIFSFKGSFVGDNSAVGNIVNQLQGVEHLSGFELETKTEPYGIILNYDWTDTEQKYRETAIYNSIYLFTLVQNVDWITFKFDGFEYKITKAELQDGSGIQFLQIKNKEELIDNTQKLLNEENNVKLFS